MARPFQNIQVNFTELPQVQRWQYLLVIVDHLTHWVKAYPTARVSAEVVSKILLEQIVPRYGIVNTIDSDKGPHFTAKVLHQITDALSITWRLHTPWRPQSSGRVEKMNQTLKVALTKLMEETKMSWLKCLSLALMRIRTKPRADVGVSPYEMLFGLPFLTTSDNIGTYEEGEQSVRKYVLTITSTLKELRQKGYLPQATPIDFNIHMFQPGNWVLIKTWKEEPLTPKWEGPFQVLLTTETAVRTQEKGWTHVSRVKGPVPAPTEWTVVGTTDTKLTLKKKPPEKLRDFLTVLKELLSYL